MTSISPYIFYLKNTIYRDNPSVLHLQNISLYTRETGEYVQIQSNYIGQNYNKLLAHSRRGEHRSPVKKCDTYGIFVLFTDYKFIITTQGKVPI